MSEWYDNQKQSISNIRQLLQERLDKTNPRRTLTADEQRRLFKLEHIAEKLRRRENVQNRQLQTWLSEDEYAQVDIEWQEQLEMREELKDKPDELKRYEDKLNTLFQPAGIGQWVRHEGRGQMAARLLRGDLVRLGDARNRR